MCGGARRRTHEVDVAVVEEDHPNAAAVVKVHDLRGAATQPRQPERRRGSQARTPAPVSMKFFQARPERGAMRA